MHYFKVISVFLLSWVAVTEGHRETSARVKQESKKLRTGRGRAWVQSVMWRARWIQITEHTSVSLVISCSRDRQPGFTSACLSQIIAVICSANATIAGSPSWFEVCYAMILQRHTWLLAGFSGNLPINKTHLAFNWQPIPFLVTRCRVFMEQSYCHKWIEWQASQSVRRAKTIL